ncbi:MAG: hypothetical protein QOK31_110 [Solirubrobacteraceae bacterium]|jgi:hypothetical protein|nr:hypothetical protein [Solirubrobacteraceae bacterium]
MAEARRVSIGFEGGQVLSTRLSEKALKGLRDALEQGGWHDLVTEDGSSLVYLPKIVYVTTDSTEHRVGFGL